MTARPLGSLLTSVFDQLSNQIAGGSRVDHRSLLPGADDPFEGVIPDEFLPGVETFDWFDPTVWAAARPDDITRVDLNAIPVPTGVGASGTGLDWFRSSEAPNNFTNRNNPLYVSRKDFVVALAPQLEEMFGVSAGGAGYYRPPAAADAAEGGRSPNSDHYSAGALDFYGTPEELTSLRNWLVEQPFVAFVRYQSESHETHLHLSIDVGWVAHNYFQDSQLPKVTPPALTLQGEPPQQPREPELPPPLPTDGGPS